MSYESASNDFFILSAHLQPRVLVALISAVIWGSLVGRFAVLLADRYAPYHCGVEEISGGVRKISEDRVVPELGGKVSCRNTQVVVARLTGAAVFVLMVARLGVDWTTVPMFLAASALMVLSVIDLRCYRLPDVVVFSSSGVSLLVMLLLSTITDNTAAMLTSILVSLGCGVFMFCVHWVNPQGLGFGDVKLSTLSGLHLGWMAAITNRGWVDVVALVLQALLISSFLGVIMGVSVVGLRQRGYNVLPDPVEASNISQSQFANTGFPFGPALSAGTLIVILFSETLLD